MPSLVVFWIVPPELSPPTVLVPLPVMVRPAVAPVLLRTMPLAPPVALTDLKVTPDAPMVALEIVTAGPVGTVVAPMLFVPVTLTVPPVAENVQLAPFNVMPPL